MCRVVCEMKSYSHQDVPSLTSSCTACLAMSTLSNTRLPCSWSPPSGGSCLSTMDRLLRDTLFFSCRNKRVSVCGFCKHNPALIPVFFCQTLSHCLRERNIVHMKTGQSLTAKFNSPIPASVEPSMSTPLVIHISYWFHFFYFPFILPYWGNGSGGRGVVQQWVCEWVDVWRINL